MSSSISPKTGSSYAEASKSPSFTTKTLVLQTWDFNKVKDVALELQNNKDDWLKVIRESMISSGKEYLLDHVDDLEVFIRQLEDIFTNLWNLAVLTSPFSFSFSFELPKDLIEQMDQFPGSAFHWLRYIRHTWRPLIHTDELYAIFNAINVVGGFVVDINTKLAQVDEEDAQTPHQASSNLPKVPVLGVNV
ncbi:hypothetical protein HYFRA_00005945 [Hymenoscyphus fraxineus]|uniref:Uncharacterized protein n=1 Tax=Hymenoscyphus fraxineus TaxID=746836 RepID=A0A9N9PUA4_9HELO|nr:hypothetical protein HYFRA_00005945 [Hymenoscyphus fraxineus]